MSLVSNILSGRVNIKRLSSFVLEETAIAVSLSPTRQPASTARLEVSVQGATVGTGSITVSGNTVETFSFSQNGSQEGSKNFTSISGITLTGISQGFIKIRALNNMGQPINQEYLVSSNTSVRFFQQNGRIKVQKSGEQQVSSIMMMAEPDADIKNLDNMYVISGIKGITMGQLDFAEAIFDFAGLTHHIEFIVKEP